MHVFFSLSVSLAVTLGRNSDKNPYKVLENRGECNKAGKTAILVFTYTPTKDEKGTEVRLHVTQQLPDEL